MPYPYLILGAGIALKGAGKALVKSYIKSKRKLSLGEKLKMQNKGIINKKTGRLHPSHESALGELSKGQVRKMTKKGYNPKLFKGKPKPGPLQTKQDIKKSLKEGKQEAKYFRDRKFK
jgi:hypothetical protein